MAKVVLITGGSRGIGAATARLAADKGYDIAISYRQNASEAEKLVHEIHGKGRKAIAVQANVGNSADIERLYTDVVDYFGRLDAVVNSAGISWHGRADEIPFDALSDLFSTNVFGVILSSKEAVKRLSKKYSGTGGVIINVSSMAATIGGRPGSSHYAATKAAVDAFTTGLAKEVAAEGIRAIAVRPGFTLTDMTEATSSDPESARSINATIPLGRSASALEIAQPIVWLLSDEASFITGAHLDVSGGGFLIGGKVAATDHKNPTVRSVN